MINFRKSKPEDIYRIMPIYESARKFMRLKGNMSQWTNGYPSAEIILSDIEAGNHYLAEDGEGEILMAFSLIFGEDPTYAVIENGSWLDKEPYVVIHRAASSGKRKGMMRECLAYCFSINPNIRIDTHEDNATMRNALLREGFSECGTIYLKDGAPRIAYQKNISST